MRAADIPVLSLEEEGSEARLLIEDEIRRAADEDGAEAVVLGCAGMADLTRQLTAKFGLPVIDGVAAAVKMVEGLVAQGLKTSKAGGYSPPPAKNYVGEFSGTDWFREDPESIRLFVVEFRSAFRLRSRTRCRRGGCIRELLGPGLRQGL